MNQDNPQTDDQPVTLINVFEVTAEHADTFVVGGHRGVAEIDLGLPR
ncbi:hypothetical protein AVDCRST_MAG82-446 [uncultured Rubrobacteraceae bacterium]|uniref:Uncharacterized protein n=1 Tax=uncultured Rubrobacteraceae bacterium TaxID=349277 RepID=A0A6J4P791_9ACTN|nr:hypothetical protein AVDCRST_MAG82-446 [uncultured Rubrobacteraceae bacterium]